jgi:hypothetical protein
VKAKNNSENRIHIPLLAGALFSLLVTSSVCGQEQPVDPVVEVPAATESLAKSHYRYWFTGGLFYPILDTSAQLNGSNSEIGTKVDLENDLGYEDSLGLLALQGGLYFTQRWRVEAQYIDLSRKSSRELTRDISWGDEDFQIGAKVRSEFGVTIFRVAVGYDIFQEETFTFGVSIGAHMLDTYAGIQAEVTTGGESVSGGVQTDASTSGFLPIPNIGLYGTYVLGNRWRLDGLVNWFGISVGEWDGTLFEADLNLRYYVYENFSLGIGLQYFYLDANYDDSDWRGNLNYSFFGPKIDLGFQF